MSYNNGAAIVPLEEMVKILRAVASGYAGVPDSYSRVQLLTEDGIKGLVFASHDRSYMVYGELSDDFPLCMDFADDCRSDVKRGALKAGLAVRPAFGTLEYTMCDKYESGPRVGRHKRHAVNWAALVDRRVLFYEPQNDTWTDAPHDCLTMDRFSL